MFLATDAASEGKNLQHGVHHLVHLDVPWNPNRYLQRNGRIDRYGQTETPHIWALVAADRKGNEGRPEYRALEIVIEKLAANREGIGIRWPGPAELHERQGARGPRRDVSPTSKARSTA